VVIGKVIDGLKPTLPLVFDPHCRGKSVSLGAKGDNPRKTHGRQAGISSIGLPATISAHCSGV
jgi:hypothetical protein